LSGTLDSRYQDDIHKMQQAAERIASFAHRGAGPASERAAEPTAGRTAGAGSRGTLLAVDDNAQNRELLNRMLERQGYSVTMAANGEECLRMLREYRFDLVLHDDVQQH